MCLSPEEDVTSGAWRGPRLVAKAQPGQIHPDQMPRAGAVVMPRKF